VISRSISIIPSIPADHGLHLENSRAGCSARKASPCPNTYGHDAVQLPRWLLDKSRRFSIGIAQNTFP